MIHRIVLFRLKDEHRAPAARAAIVDHARAVFAELPHVQDASIGPAADEQSAEHWDLALIVRFSDLDAVAQYLPHPDHRAFVDYISERSTAKQAFNFETE